MAPVWPSLPCGRTRIAGLAIARRSRSSRASAPASRRCETHSRCGRRCRPRRRSTGGSPTAAAVSYSWLPGTGRQRLRNLAPRGIETIAKVLQRALHVGQVAGQQQLRPGSGRPARPCARQPPGASTSRCRPTTTTRAVCPVGTNGGAGGAGTATWAEWPGSLPGGGRDRRGRPAWRRSATRTGWSVPSTEPEQPIAHTTATPATRPAQRGQTSRKLSSISYAYYNRCHVPDPKGRRSGAHGGGHGDPDVGARRRIPPNRQDSPAFEPALAQPAVNPAGRCPARHSVQAGLRLARVRPGDRRKGRHVAHSPRRDERRNRQSRRIPDRARSQQDGRWRDVFVNWRTFRQVEVTVGRFKVPFGREELISITDLDFAFRTLGVDALSRRRATRRHGARPFLRRGFTYEVGVFDDDGDNGRLQEPQFSVNGETEGIGPSFAGG